MKTEKEQRKVQEEMQIKKLKNATKNTLLKNVLGAEVTWTAVAAIGGASIIIWNIIKYIFTFLSSLYFQRFSSVPIYLLMKRHNLPFSETTLFILTITTMVWIISFTELNPILYNTSKIFETAFSVYLLFGGIFSIYLLYYDYYAADSIITKSVLFILFYILPLSSMLPALVLGRNYFFSRKMDKAISIEYTKEGGKRVKKRFGFIIKTFFHRAVICFVVFIFIFVNNTLALLIPKEFYFDQYDRYIVVDLGEQYIVHECFIDEKNKEIIMNSSCYQVIDSSNEIIRKIQGWHLYYDKNGSYYNSLETNSGNMNMIKQKICD